MKQKKHVLSHSVVLLVTLIVASVLFGELFRPKFNNDNYWPLDVTYESFYEMEENTVDVLFLGSSHAISAFSPQELYDETGIRSFNLSSEEQSLLVSYYWLREALRFQKPKAVVLDTVVCFPYTDTPYNCTEPSIRKALEPMKWSSVKWEAISAISSLDPKETFASYLFPIIRYHARWNDLTYGDIHFWPPQNTSLKGYAVLSEDYGKEDYVPLTEEPAVPAGTHPLMMEYLDRIVSLCKEEGIELILVSTPYMEATGETHQAMADYASKNALTYIDFNLEDVIQEMDFVFRDDMADAGHANTSGAVKLTDYIGAVCVEHGIPSKADEQYERSRAYVNRQIKNANLYRIDNMKELMGSINYDQYLIFVNGSDSSSFSSLEIELEEAWDSPVGLIMEDGIVTDISDQKIQGYRFFDNISYKILPGDKSSSITINGVTYTRNTEGVQIILLEREKGYVIDHSCYDRNGQRVQ